MSLIEIFLDESGDTASYALGGLIGADENWSGFAEDWNSVLGKHGLRGASLHMRELQGSQQEPWVSLREDVARLDALLDDLVTVIIACKLVPFAAVLLMDEYGALNAEGKRRWPNPYKLCFETALKAAVETCDVSGGRQICMTFDKGCNQGWAKQAYKKLTNNDEAKLFAEDAKFEDDASRPEVSAADMIVYEIRRAFYNYHVHKKNELRRSFQRLILAVPHVFWKVNFENVIDGSKVIDFPNTDGAVAEIFIYQDDPKP
jgi:hypothetical protein